MIIRNYKLFEEKLELKSEIQELLVLAIKADELKMVKFFLKRGAIIDGDALYDSLDYDEIFNYFLTKKLSVESLKNSPAVLKELDVQKYLIDKGQISKLYNETSFHTDLIDSEKYSKIIRDYFISNKINDDFSLKWSFRDMELLSHFLSKKLDVKKIPDRYLKWVEIQKLLIDHGYEQFIYDGVGFNDKLKDVPKYAGVVDMMDQTSKFNL